MRKVGLLLVVTLVALIVCGAATNDGSPRYDTDGNPVMLGVDTVSADSADTLGNVRWVLVDSTGVVFVRPDGGAVSVDSISYLEGGIVDSVGVVAEVDTVHYVAEVGSVVNTVITRDEYLYPYFTSGIMDSTDVDTMYVFPLPVRSFWLQNMSSSDTLYISWIGPSAPASYISIFPLASFGLENIWRPDSLNGLFLAGSVDSLPWELVVLSDSLYIP